MGLPMRMATKNNMQTTNLKKDNTRTAKIAVNTTIELSIINL